MFRLYFLKCLFASFLFHVSFGQTLTIEDDYIETFLKDIMQNYTSWTGNAPLPPMPDLLKLEALNEDGVDINMEIRNHTMSGYFETTRDSYYAVSIFGVEALGVYREVINEPFTFSGDYIATGLLRVNETLNISFSGQGSWKLKTERSLESLIYTGYKIDAEEYIDLIHPDTLIFWGFKTYWSPYKLTGIEFDYEGQVDPYWRHYISQVWVKLYENFLHRTEEPFADQAPPRKLLHSFLVTKTAKTKMSEIIPGWKPTTTTPTLPTNSPSKGNSFAFVNFFLSCLVPVVTLMSVIKSK